MKTAMLTVVPLALAAGVWADTSKDMSNSGGDDTKLPTLTYAKPDDYPYGYYRDGKFPKWEVKAFFTSDSYWKKYKTPTDVSGAYNEILTNFAKGCLELARAEQPTLTDSQVHLKLYQPKQPGPVIAFCFVPFVDEATKELLWRDYMEKLGAKLGYKIKLTKDSPKPINKVSSSEPHA